MVSERRDDPSVAKNSSTRHKEISVGKKREGRNGAGYLLGGSYLTKVFHAEFKTQIILKRSQWKKTADSFPTPPSTKSHLLQPRVNNLTLLTASSGIKLHGPIWYSYINSWVITFKHYQLTSDYSRWGFCTLPSPNSPPSTFPVQAYNSIIKV